MRELRLIEAKPILRSHHKWQAGILSQAKAQMAPLSPSTSGNLWGSLAQWQEQIQGQVA